MARAAFKGDLDAILRDLTINILGTKTKTSKLPAIINIWIGQHQESVDRWHDIVANLRNASTNEFSMLSVAMRELVELAQQSGR